EARPANEKLAAAIERKTGRWLPLIKEKCEKYGMSQYIPLVQAIMFQESGGNPDARGRNRNGSVDQGLMQLNNRFFKDPNIMDPAVNLDYAVKNIKALINRYGGNIVDIASGYNCGHAEGEVIGQKTLGIPASTKNHYVPGIIKYMSALGWQNLPERGNYGDTMYA
ncbi:lytic transglycosylase domain-containing protein, partial [Patescibacteria group bacterium]|nr:lytic transglycosylase domain-containing protein [Patescibacteria group bacterium]MBU1703641.1 lytic transglycosylase domain-containing protein [Patescibacteria group bacterium]MBU1954252.1 lytic transglycosylase domain-containing protein [Patescibacteria group bacterium]